jgi:hypothetical protein
VRDSGRDPVVATTGKGDGARVAGAGGDWLVIAHSTAPRGSCGAAWIETLNARTGARGRNSGMSPADGSCDRSYEPLQGTWAVATGAGVPAWIAVRSGEAVASVLSIAPDGSLVTLDRGTATTSIAGLRAVGSRFSWTTDGVARHAIAP